MHAGKNANTFHFNTQKSSWLMSVKPIFSPITWRTRPFCFVRLITQLGVFQKWSLWYNGWAGYSLKCCFNCVWKSLCCMSWCFILKINWMLCSALGVWLPARLMFADGRGSSHRLSENTSLVFSATRSSPLKSRFFYLWIRLEMSPTDWNCRWIRFGPQQPTYDPLKKKCT